MEFYLQSQFFCFSPSHFHVKSFNFEDTETLRISIVSSFIFRARNRKGLMSIRELLKRQNSSFVFREVPVGDAACETPRPQHSRTFWHLGTAMPLVADRQ